MKAALGEQGEQSLRAHHVPGSHRHEEASGAQRASSSGGGLRDEMAGVLSPKELDEIFDPATYLGSAEVFVDDALRFYARRGG